MSPRQSRRIDPSVVSRMALLAIAIGATSAAHQPTFKSAANYIRVDVYPTVGGKPVEDLIASDFQLLEDGKLQTIDAFEHVEARSARVGARQAETAHQPPHRRAFVVFLDASHVSSAGSQKIAEPLIRLLDSVISEGDVVGVMTADMTASSVELGAKTDVLVGALRAHPNWGRRDDRTRFDETEQRYIACYPVLRAEAANGRQLSELAQKLIERRRERRTLDALNGLVTFLGEVEDTRKTVIVITEGWVLFGSDQQMLEPRRLAPTEPKTEAIPGRPGITVGRDGKIATDDPANLRSLRYPCEADRLALSSVDDQRYLRDIIGNANRRNASFYTIDPRGLAVFDASIQSDRPALEALPLRYDAANLQASHSAMRILASETDGFAVLDTNDLDRGMRRIAQDVGSYYLLAYYSTNTRPDGKFREITVRVRRPGVDVRARRGYRAPTAEELAAAAAPPRPATAARTNVAAALAELDLQLARDRQRLTGPIRLFRRGPLTGNRFVPAESLLFSRTDRIRLERPLRGSAGAAATARLLDRNGRAVTIPLTAVERTDDSGQRWIATELVLAPLGAGDYIIEVDVGGETTLTAVRVTR